MKWTIEGDSDARGMIRSSQDHLERPLIGGRASTIEGLGLKKMGVVHDMRNLLQIICSAVQLIEGESGRGDLGEVHRLADCALEAAERVAALSQEMLDAELTVQAVDVASVLLEMKDLISITAGPSVDVAVLVEDNIPAVLCDRRGLENATLNLAANARDAMPNGGELAISLCVDPDSRNVSNGKSDVVLRVSDTGEGMSPEILALALAPLFTTKPRDKGTGLGLSMVKDFTERCGGSVVIESAPGRGTLVSLRLPIAFG